MSNPNFPNFNSDDSGIFSYEHLVSVDNEMEDEDPSSNTRETEDAVDITIDHNYALWGDAFPSSFIGEVFGEGDIPLTPYQNETKSARSRHNRQI